MLAKALAGKQERTFIRGCKSREDFATGEANVPFFYASGAEFSAGPYYGSGVGLVKRLFRQARRHRRSIIFIDEFDALARQRTSSGTTSPSVPGLLGASLSEAPCRSKGIGRTPSIK
jgi:SpoVK/Ycf46/Vps4 family AAA+-type ATPase